jgi:hypothetical protein
MSPCISHHYSAPAKPSLVTSLKLNSRLTSASIYKSVLTQDQSNAENGLLYGQIQLPSSDWSGQALYKMLPFPYFFLVPLFIPRLDNLSPNLKPIISRI